MGEHKLHREQLIKRPLPEVFAFFSDARNLEAITPPWLNFRITDAPDAIVAGSLIRYKLRVRGLPLSWTTQILHWEPPHRFVDLQLKGPYALWHHTHKFTAVAPDETLVEDTVRYKLPLDPLSAPIHSLLVRRDIEKIFDFRFRAIERLLTPKALRQGTPAAGPLAG